MLWRRTSLALAFLSGLVTSQAPEFAQQYFQRLGGAIDELSRQVAAFDADSGKVGFSRQQGAAHLRASDDFLTRARGERIVEDETRLDRLKQQQEAMRDAAPLSRVRGALVGADARVATGAWADFKPALPLTADGALCAAAGFVGLLAALRGFARLFRPREKGFAKAAAT
jgi:hypothetical protein